MTIGASAAVEVVGAALHLISRLHSLAKAYECAISRCHPELVEGPPPKSRITAVPRQARDDNRSVSRGGGCWRCAASHQPPALPCQSIRMCDKSLSSRACPGTAT